jgi:YtoQ family protein
MLGVAHHPLVVYLAGEIHTDWRDELRAAVERRDLCVSLVSPVTEHSASDHCAHTLIAERESGFWGDQASAGINAIRTRTLIARADVVVARFSLRYVDYYEWNSAFDAGRAAALGKPLITLHPSELDHPLKEVDRGALAVARDAEQVAAILAYTFSDLTSGEVLAAGSGAAA